MELGAQRHIYFGWLTKRAVFYRTMVEDILGVPNKSIGITAYTDSKSVLEGLFSTNLVNDKRLRVDFGAIREFIETKSNGVLVTIS